MRTGKLHHSDDQASLDATLVSVVNQDEELKFIALVNDRRFKYLAITSTRFIFIHPKSFKVLRYMSHKHVTKMRFNMGMWHIETVAQPLTYIGVDHSDREAVLEVFRDLGLPIK
ncbi:MAG: hypothetical protein RLZZ330_228 [Actinomycetota bacterium]|jgi:hypothetical protein